MNEIYVIMGNDYPSSVWSRKDKADLEIKRLEEREATPSTAKYNGKVFYRVYTFVLNEEEN